MMDSAKLEALKAQHGELFVIETDDGEALAFRRPTRAEYKRFKANALDEQKRMDADEQLVRAVTIYPDAEGFAALLDRKPALATSMAGEVLKVAGAVQGLEAKKA
jgi:hypothetical protein